MKITSHFSIHHLLHSALRRLPTLAAILALLVIALQPATAALASGLSQTRTSTIDVYKFEDLNSDGVWQQGTEQPLANWTFDLYRNVNGVMTFQASGVTDQAGHIVFGNLTSGSYRVSEQTQIEYTATTPKDQTITLATGQSGTLYFGNILRPVDFGDLPNNYNMTTRAQNGARHQPGAIYLGGAPDTELDGQPTANASGDDLNGVADEDGVQVVASPPVYWSQGQGTVDVTVTGGVGCLFAWVDAWDSNANAPGADGDFNDSGTGWQEAIYTNLTLAAGTHTLSFPLPVGAGKTPIFARFRLAPSFSGNCSYYTANPVTTHGFIEGGEVEDYYINFTPTAVSLASFTAEPAGLNYNLAGLAVILLAAAGLLLGRRMLIVRQHSRS